jgi:2-succinyl-5-enolpyruvyl-6-hydroxy-3-cyclohexene-1-carboxylate synthase
MTSTTTTDTYMLLRAFVDELARCGMRVACTSPGSRSAPLALTLAREERLDCHSHVDERCAGFFALGAAKASGLPVAVTCTSGTAAAELLPAAIEAYEARVPLLLLTADRPPELREHGAGQAIDQLKLFGGAAKWFFEVGTHDATPARLRWMRTLACRAYWTALEGRPGMVHLNFPLREPLVTDEPLAAEETGRPGGRPYVLRPPAPAAGGGRLSDLRLGEGDLGEVLLSDREHGEDRLSQALAGARRGVVVAGRHERDTPLGQAAAAFCEAAGWPLLADPLSGARRGAAAIAHYDALLRDESFCTAQRPDLVLRVGDLPVSKPLRMWLAGLEDVRQVAFDPEGAWQDPASVLSDSLALEPAEALAELSAPPADPDWLESWRSADELAAEAIIGGLAGAGISEPALAAELGVLLPAAATLFVASSMPVRDIETFWPVREDPPRVLCNRGANGIDGTVSSAFGAAAASAGPVVLLIGDVALAHDIGGLLAARRLGLKLTIVLLDNDGGGIFDFLAVSRTAMARKATVTRHRTDAGMPGVGRAPGKDPASTPAPDSEDIYTRHIATPTGLDFAQAAALYGLAHERVATIRAFRGALERALSSQAGSTLVHVQTDRASNVALHGRVWSVVSRAYRGSGTAQGSEDE